MNYMRLKNILAILAISFASCNNSKSDKQASIAALNAQSLKCISIMNQAGEQQSAATAAGDKATALALQTTIDSAATENAKIGQQLMALQAE